MSRVKIMHVHEVEKEAYYFNNLVDHTNRESFELSFVSFANEGEFSQSMRERGITVHLVEPIRKIGFLRSGRIFWSLLKKEKPDIVHTHLFNPTVIGLNLSKWQGRKTVLTRHHSDAVHKMPSGIKRRFYFTLEGRNNRLADHIIAPSRMVRDCVVDLEGTPSERVSVIPYGQTHERFDRITPASVVKTRKELAMDGHVSLVCVSRLYHRKGHVYLFEAMSKLIDEGNDLRLYLVGSGDYEAELRIMAKKLNILNKVEFLGWRDDVLELIAAADIIVHPSLEDALSQSLIESLMLGKPIVATDISGASDTLDNGKYGKLVRPSDADELTHAMRETLSDIPAACAAAAKGREYILDYMDAQRVTDEYAAIYGRVLANE